LQINILCVGDVVGRPGRHILSRSLPALVKERDVHCVICNAENAAAGSGLTTPLYEKLLKYGVNIVTLGDHVYRKNEIIATLETSDCIVRPANLAPGAPGKTNVVYETQPGPRIAVVTLLGRIYMRPPTDCPFRAVDQILNQLSEDIRIVVVEVHAEATSEKIAMGWHLDGRVSAVFGTHTHVTTADERILPNGTAYITDLGMTGPHDSVLGRRKDRVLKSLITNVPCPFDVATEDVRLCGALIQVDSATGKAIHIERIRLDGTERPEYEPGEPP
jgi:metallophosphoesterase (TIGR00282 family)